MSNDSHRNPESSLTEVMNHNRLWEYVQSLNPQTVKELSKPASREVLYLIQRAVMATLGNLPSDRFNTTITTSRDELGKLLGSAMVDGYFLRNAEQRLELEKRFLPNNHETNLNIYPMIENSQTEE
ncbi:Protein of unknown function (DUF760) [Nostoc sp. PCC 7524]|uniref:DUF760 domain-containing protein n=1 Tax=Nostoc sp. (strain ATCC 29411 / PCC 7524) TaxID=28072 RepID=UPI00029EC574|nr:DUF760 domain-containing protein [Nostoc sp. PCC 7524]AFY48287.1 Protein of unknown function (DUF760) [Nostoc sp. PCC 7524]